MHKELISCALNCCYIKITGVELIPKTISSTPALILLNSYLTLILLAGRALPVLSFTLLKLIVNPAKLFWLTGVITK